MSAGHSAATPPTTLPATVSAICQGCMVMGAELSRWQQGQLLVLGEPYVHYAAKRAGGSGAAQLGRCVAPGVGGKR